MCALKRPHTDWQKGRLPSQGDYFDYSQVEVKLFFNIKKNMPPHGHSVPNLPPSRESI